MFLRFLVSFLFIIITSSVQADPILINIEGNNYYMVSEDTEFNEWYDSADGYCFINGYEYAAYYFTSLKFQVEPLVALDPEGNIFRTYEKNKGQLWVITDVSCV